MIKKEDVINAGVSYDPKTGEFFRLKNGEIISILFSKTARTQITINTTRYEAWKMAALFITGEYPSEDFIVNYEDDDRRNLKANNLTFSKTINSSLITSQEFARKHNLIAKSVYHRAMNNNLWFQYGVKNNRQACFFKKDDLIALFSNFTPSTRRRPQKKPSLNFNQLAKSFIQSGSYQHAD
jgi:hypothetical protein